MPLSKATLESCVQEDLRVDSLDAIEMLLWIEDEFSLNIPDETTEKGRTVRDVVGLSESEVKPRP